MESGSCQKGRIHLSSNFVSTSDLPVATAENLALSWVCRWFSDKTDPYVPIFLPTLPLLWTSWTSQQRDATDFMDGSNSYQLRSQMEPEHMCSFSSIIQWLGHTRTWVNSSLRSTKTLRCLHSSAAKPAAQMADRSRQRAAQRCPRTDKQHCNHCIMQNVSKLNRHNANWCFTGDISPLWTYISLWSSGYDPGMIMKHTGFGWCESQQGRLISYVNVQVDNAWGMTGCTLGRVHLWLQEWLDQGAEVHTCTCSQ